MENKRNKKKYYFVLLIVLLCFHLVSNMLLFKGNPLPEGKDSYAHASTFINFLQIIKTGSEHPSFMPGKGILYNLIFISFDYPPLFYFIAYLLYLLSFIMGIKAACLTS